MRNKTMSMMRATSKVHHMLGPSLLPICHFGSWVPCHCLSSLGACHHPWWCSLSCSSDVPKPSTWSLLPMGTEVMLQTRHHCWVWQEHGEETPHQCQGQSHQWGWGQEVCGGHEEGTLCHHEWSQLCGWDQGACGGHEKGTLCHHEWSQLCGWDQGACSGHVAQGRPLWWHQRKSYQCTWGQEACGGQLLQGCLQWWHQRKSYQCAWGQETCKHWWVRCFQCQQCWCWCCSLWQHQWCWCWGPMKGRHGTQN